uniref:SCAN box domain-containing protein n=1 Tax=Xenopus tropicalis TaxID=8364 RepID=A0A803K8C6_XENTR
RLPIVFSQRSGARVYFPVSYFVFVTEAARSQMFDLIHLARKWLQPDINSAIHIVELLVMDRFLRALPASLRRWVSQSDPQNVDQLVALVERYIAAGELNCPSNVEPMQCDMSYKGKPHSLLTRKAGSEVVSCYAGKPQW